MKQLFKISYINRYNNEKDNYFFLSKDELKEIEPYITSVVELSPTILTDGEYFHDGYKHKISNSKILVYIVVDPSGKAHYERFLPCDYPSTSIYKNLGLI